MKRLLFFLLLLASGCSAAPTPTFYTLQEYPATWTPAPTPTNTPPGPTATLVIQHTPGAPPTRDPNARVLPTAPRGGIGIWMDYDRESSKTLADLLPRAQVIVTDGAALRLLKPNQTVLFRAPSLSSEPLALVYDGVLLETLPTDAATLPNLREQLKPRLVLARAFITDTTGLDSALSNLDGVMLENFMRAPNALPDQFPDEAAWRAQVEALARLSAAPDTMVLTATRFSPATPLEAPLVEQWVNYALGSFLLGAKNARSFFGFPYSKAQPFINVPALSAELGQPFGEMVKAGGVYQRRFARGLVLVNPTNEKHAVGLARPYQDLSGKSMTQFEMLPHTGVILINAP